MRASKPALPDEYLVDNRVYTDPDVFRLELERIFPRAWNYVCHESEIRRPGDFVARSVAGQPVVVNRNASGEIRAFYNTCRHRAMRVVLDPCGNAGAFTCIYHRWTYDLDGRLLGVPGVEAYTTSYNPGGLCKEDFGLVPVRVESAHRLVFVCLDDETPSLADYLGDVADRFALPFGHPDFQITLMRTERIRANWKMQPENSRDGYHAPLLHRRLFQVSKPKPYWIYPHGHAARDLGLDYESGLKARTLDPVLLDNPEMIRAFQRYPLPGLRQEYPGYVVTLFPELLVLARLSTAMIERQVPVSTYETDIEIYGGSLTTDTDEIREVRQKHWDLYWSSTAGNFIEDKLAWEMQQEGVASAGVRYSLLARGEPATHAGISDDNIIRAFWAEWRCLMGVASNAPPGA